MVASWLRKISQARPRSIQCWPKAKAAGARILKPGAKTFWGGYSGYFADLDGHLWEIAFNPHWELSKDGSLTLPE
jgi:uncharacterized glyoxalase superfamily protein PhnB